MPSLPLPLGAYAPEDLPEALIDAVWGTPHYLGATEDVPPTVSLKLTRYNEEEKLVWGPYPQEGGPQSFYVFTLIVEASNGAIAVPCKVYDDGTIEPNYGYLALQGFLFRMQSSGLQDIFDHRHRIEPPTAKRPNYRVVETEPTSPVV